VNLKYTGWTEEDFEDMKQKVDRMRKTRGSGGLTFYQQPVEQQLIEVMRRLIRETKT